MAVPKFDRLATTQNNTPLPPLPKIASLAAALQKRGPEMVAALQAYDEQWENFHRALKVSQPTTSVVQA